MPLQLADDAAGNVVACPACRQPLRVPDLLPAQRGQITGTPPPTVQPAYWQGAAGPQLALPSRSWWKPVSPSFLAAAVLLFFLPWVNIRCSGGGPMGGTMLASQSGFQAVYGGYTLSTEMDNTEVKHARQRAEGPQRSAPLLALYPLLLIGGIVCGLAIRPDGRRRWLVGGLAGAALVVLLIQVAVGLPLAQELASTHGHIGEELQRSSRFDDLGMKGLAAGVALSIEAQYTAWLWLCLLANLAAVIAPLAEGPALRRLWRRVGGRAWTG
jgi:hypothetical protein